MNFAKFNETIHKYHQFHPVPASDFYHSPPCTSHNTGPQSHVTVLIILQYCTMTVPSVHRDIENSLIFWLPNMFFRFQMIPRGKPMKKRTVALYGHNLVLSTIGACLQQSRNFGVVRIDGSLADYMNETGAAYPEVILFDLATAPEHLAVSLMQHYPEIKLVGVDLMCNKYWCCQGSHPACRPLRIWKR